jgi:CheY-like chemotaxis protein
VGPGGPPERRATLFSAGFSTRAGGAGVGLRHAAALARANGGSLTLAESSRDDRGARFELMWPLRSSPSTPLPPPPESGRQLLETPSQIMRAMPLAGTRILLVEDDDAVVDLLDTALTARGADVVSIRHRKDLAAALASGPFDAALFDISPIEEDVVGAVALARGSQTGGAPLRVVLISGSAAQMPDMPLEWVSAWVRKPFEVSEILQAIAPAAPTLR